ncbi:MAG: PAS domain S-box protein [Planctomycetaceae bacterium]
MRTNLHRSLIAGTTLMVVLLAVGAAVNYRNIQGLNANSELIAHTLEVDRIAADLLRLTSDAVVSQRGYLLSGDASFLDVYRTTIAALPERREELRQLTRDNPHQQDRLSELESGLDELERSLESGITLREQGLGTAEAIVAAKSVRIRLDEIRKIVESLRGEERLLLAARETQARDAYRGALLGGVVSLLLGLALFAGLVELARRNLEANQVYQSHLHAEREQLQVTLSSIGDAVIATDASARITQLNRVAEKLTGWSHQEALGQPVHTVLKTRDEQTHKEQSNLVERVLVSGQGVHDADGTELLTGNDEWRTISGSAAPIRSTDGALQGVVLTFRDITEDRAARRAEAARTRLVQLRADIGLLISRTGETRDILHQCAAEIARQLPADAVGIWESVSEDEPLVLAAAAGPAAAAAPATLPARAGDDLLRQVAATRTRTASLQFRPQVQGDGRERRVGFPLVIEDRLIGVLIVSIPETADASTEEELEPLAAKLTQYMDRRRVEEARQQSEQMFRTLANSIPQLAWMARPDGYIFWYNQRWFDFTGTTLEEMQGWGWQSVHDPGELPTVLSTIKHSFATGEPWEHTFPLRRHDGVLRWHLSRMLPVRDDAGRIVLWFGTNTDITEQREATQALRRSEAFARGVVNSSPDCLKVLDLEGRLVWMNEAGRQLMQVCDFDSLKGSDWSEFWNDSGVRDDVRQALSKARGGESGRFQGACPTLQGEPRWWDVAISPISGPDDHTEQLLVVSRDITKQREAEEQIRRSEANLRRVIDSMFAFVGILSADGTLIEVNRAPVEAAGLTREDVVGRKFWDCHWWTYAPEAQVRLRAAFETALAGDVVRYDTPIRVSDGSMITIDFQLQPVFDDEELLFLIPSGVDITDRKRAEEELLASQDFLRSALDALSSHIAVLDANGTIITVNQAWRDFAVENGWDAAGFGIGQNYLSACQSATARDADEAGEVESGIMTVLRGEAETYSLEYPCHSPTEYRWFQMRVNRFSGPGPARAVVSHENITNRMLSEQATLRWSEQLQSLAEISVNLAAASEVDAVLESVTQRACQLVEAYEAETLWTFDTDWSTARRRTTCAEGQPLWLQETWSESDPIHTEVRGTNRPLRLTTTEWCERHADRMLAIDLDRHCGGCLAAPLTDRDGRNIGLIQVCGKLSGEFNDDDEAILVQLAQMASVALERARLYEEIRLADLRKDEFLALLAHELRNPLSALTAGTQLIVLHPEDSPQVAETGDVILRQCFQLKQLVDDLLDVSRISRGKISLERRAVSLRNVIGSAVETARPVIQSADHQLSLHLCDNDPYVEGDDVRLAQVISNLLINAAKYTPSGGEIVLTLELTEEAAMISVRDNGIGIPEDKLESIFELFTQVDTSHSRSQGGLGIGLTLAQTLVQLHNGRLQVFSDGEGQGSTFTVELPLLARSKIPQTDADKSRVPVQELPSYRILAVDDNRSAVHLLSRLLQTLNQEVHTASDGEAALARISEFNPDVVISDIAMPGLTGYDLARSIRELPGGRNIILVALTGYGQEADREAAVEAGFNLHLTKPVSIDQLMELLGALPTQSGR